MPLGKRGSIIHGETWNIERLLILDHDVYEVSVWVTCGMDTNETATSGHV